MPRPRTVADQKILEAAAAVVGDVGPDRLTLADVGRRVGLSPATLLQRFGSRRDLLLALAAHDVDAVPTRIRASTEAVDVLDALVAALVDLAATIDEPARFGNHVAFLLKDLADPDFQQIAHRYGAGVTAAITDVLTVAADQGQLSDTDIPALAELVHVVYNGALLTWGMTGHGSPAATVERHLRSVLGTGAAEPARSTAR